MGFLQATFTLFFTHTKGIRLSNKRLKYRPFSVTQHSALLSAQSQSLTAKVVEVPLFYWR